MEKLISMVDYCQEVSKEFMMPKKPFDKNEWFGKILNYSDFLKQPLTLGMFIPCKLVNGIWVVLECPHNFGLLHTYPTGHKLMDENFKEALEYQEAKDRVLFKGFEKIITNNSGSFEIMKDGFQVYYYKSIPDYCLWLGSQKEKLVEDLVKYDLELTDSAKKKIGYE